MGRDFGSQTVMGDGGKEVMLDAAGEALVMQCC